MRDADCVSLLQWALPRLGFRWPGFRRVRRQVCKRISRRLNELGLAGPGAYRAYLHRHEAEWRILDGFCRITISRFYRDRWVYQTLASEVLPELAAGTGESCALRVWSAGCGAGEEPYTLAILHRHADDPRLRAVEMPILATDSDPHQLERARQAVYSSGCARDLPAELRRAAFEELDDRRLRLRQAYRREVRFLLQDLRRTLPEGPFELILCRNLAFTYFAEAHQKRVLEDLLTRLASGGALVVGSQEHPPTRVPPLEPWPGCPAILTWRQDAQSGR